MLMECGERGSKIAGTEERLLGKMKGIYVLVISITRKIIVLVGSLGEISFQKGTYLYVGSAQNGLLKRVLRHLKNNGKVRFWNIDYLFSSRACRVLKVFYREGESPVECRVADLLSRRGVSVRRFGSSDCRCKGHLFRIQCDYAFLEETMKELELTERS